MEKERKNKTTDFRVMIRRLMVEKGDISIAKLARHPDVDLNYGTLWKYLTNQTNMTGENIEKVIDTLKAM
jgi:hypothetical protein